MYGDRKIRIPSLARIKTQIPLIEKGYMPVTAPNKLNYASKRSQDCSFSTMTRTQAAQ
jgi:hypothetical protein